MGRCFREYEFVLPDGSVRYEMVAGLADAMSFKALFGAASARPVPLRSPGVAVVGHNSGNVVVSNRMVVIDDAGSCAVPSPLDLDLLTEVIEALEDELSSNAMVMSPADKAEAIVGLYELALEDAAGDVSGEPGGDDFPKSEGDPS